MRRDRWAMVGLIVLAAATRLPLWGPTQGEPDSGCILVDVWLWMQHWPHLTRSNFVYGYFPILSPGYFALWGHLGRWLAIPGGQLGGWLNGLDLLAEIAGAPVLYLVGRRFLPGAVAGTAAALYLLAPAYWWLGLEAHPEGPMILLALVALELFLGARPGLPGRWSGSRGARLAAATGVFGMALLSRCDGILLVPVFAACAWLQLRGHDRHGARAAVRVAGATAMVAGGAGLLFVWGQAAILGQSVEAARAVTVSVVTRFAMRAALFHQLLPVVTAVGPAVFAFAAAGWGWLALRGRGSGYGWLGAAAVPGLLFWMPITGNVVRHVVALWTALLWAGCAGWWMAGGRVRRAMGPAAALAVGLNWLVLPPNSNVNVYPSPDVVVSHRMSVERQGEIAAVAAELAAGAEAGKRACYLGTGTNQFLVADLLLGEHPARVTALDDAWQQARWPEGTAWIGEAYTDVGFERAWATCGQVISLEYAPPARHLWFVGGELGRSPLYAALERWTHRVDMRDATPTTPPAAVQADFRKASGYRARTRPPN